MSEQAENNNERQYDFSINYSERVIQCHVVKRGNQVSLHMDNNLDAELELQPDGSLKQVSGHEVPASNLQFIAKHIVEQDQ